MFGNSASGKSTITLFAIYITPTEKVSSGIMGDFTAPIVVHESPSNSIMELFRFSLVSRREPWKIRQVDGSE